MSQNFLIDWAMLAVSLFNTSLLLWLGLTVLLNAERRTWGIWLTGSGLLVGSAFFLSHSAILGYRLDTIEQDVNFWWRLGWLPLIISPFAWYVVILWYSGFWEAHQSPTQRWRKLWFTLTLITTIGSIALLAFSNPLPSFTQAIQFNLFAAPAVNGIPVLILLYPIYILACIGLSLDALLRPGPTLRVMGQAARRRARPWLIAASIVLLVVSLLVGWVMIWIVMNVNQRFLDLSLVKSIAWFDLTISLLIAAATILTGQAIVSYEVFTGRSLPRRGLVRYWQRALILAAGYGILIGLSLTLSLHTIYSLLLSTTLMVVFYALLSWRSYVERDRFISQLRPFVTSQQLYTQLTTPSDEPYHFDSHLPFEALCRDILGARLAYLAALGPMAPLFGTPLAYPQAHSYANLALSEIAEQVRSPDMLSLPIDPARMGLASLAVPLWSERGLIGMLLLGEKLDGGLYTQEEIEIARMVGERLMDTQASSEMARRLIVLQRHKLAESQVVDQRTRRVLHDDVLPRLHTAILAMNTQGREMPVLEQADILSQLTVVHHQVAELLRDMPAPTSLQVTQLGLIGALEHVVENELKSLFDHVKWTISAEARQETQKLPVMQSEVLFYAAREVIRNAAYHGRSASNTAPLHLSIQADWQAGLCLSIEDNGVGFDREREEEKSLTHAGSGQGLALHSTMLAVIGGALSVESVSGKSTRVTITYP